MTIELTVPGGTSFTIDHLLLDVNGTLTEAGALLDGVEERIEQLGERVTIALLSADTQGTMESLAAQLGVAAHRVSTGEEKRWFVERLGGDGCSAVGNGRNDAEMLRAVALGIVVIGPEGAAPAAIAAADVVCTGILDALDLLADESLLISTLRP